MQRGNLGWPFWLEATMAAITAALTMLTLVWRDWIEALTGINIDRGSGATEWLIVFALAIVTVGLGATATARWRRHRVTQPA